MRQCGAQNRLAANGGGWGVPKVWEVPEGLGRSLSEKQWREVEGSHSFFTFLHSCPVDAAAPFLQGTFVD